MDQMIFRLVFSPCPLTNFTVSISVCIHKELLQAVAGREADKERMLRMCTLFEAGSRVKAY